MTYTIKSFLNEKTEIIETLTLETLSVTGFYKLVFELDIDFVALSE